MKATPVSISTQSISPRRRSRGQSLVEFTLILPLMLLVIFMVIELGRLLAAWLAVENSARFGIRAAVTGNYDDAYCDPVLGCEAASAAEDSARLQTIRDAAACRRRGHSAE